jgi:hypothetical protein
LPYLALVFGPPLGGLKVSLSLLPEREKEREREREREKAP